LSFSFEGGFSGLGLGLLVPEVVSSDPVVTPLAGFASGHHPQAPGAHSDSGRLQVDTRGFLSYTGLLFAAP
jgi:hypothetical protein